MPDSHIPSSGEPTIDLSSHDNKRPNWWKLGYDIFMLAVISIDLLIIGLDLVLMSGFADAVANWLGLEHLITYYVSTIHNPLRIIGGIFTLFLVAELLVRWVLSIISQEYMRWFFFPFIHWYEVLGCFPQFRGLRLLRVVVIIRRLYQYGYRILPESWIVSMKFYYALLLEELADRVILIATDNLRQQFADDKSNSHLLNHTLNRNREALRKMLASMMRQEILPHLQSTPTNMLTKELSVIVGKSVQQSLENTPELRRYLRLIPIAGGLIESQLMTISQRVGENLITALTERLMHPDFINEVIDTISHTIAHIEIENSELDILIGSIVEDGLTAFEQQVKIQQWKHSEHLEI